MGSIVSTRSIVLFVGAGASRPYGVPTANAIAHRIVGDVLGSSGGKLLRGIDDVYNNPLRHVLKSFLVSTFPAIGEYEAGRPAITDILSIVDYSIATETILPIDLDDGSVFDMHEVRRALEHCVMEIIASAQEKAVTINANAMSTTQAPSSQGNILAVDTLRQLATNINAWTESRTGTFTLISTNYDTIIDRVVYDVESEEADHQFPHTDVGTTFRVRYSEQGTLIPRNTNASKRLFKLHGSLNWLKCPACENLYIASVDENLTKFVENTYGVEALNDCHCGHAPLRPLIISPSYVRDVRDTALREIWRSAQESLRMADVWIFVGYSLPAEDVAIRSMIARARMSRNSSTGGRRIHVYDIVPSTDNSMSDVEARYKVLLEGNNTALTYHSGGLEEFLNDMRNGFDALCK
ncbi:MAG: hypothetical protein FGM24_11505 [Candidatus Kapabacteria bacterium]|nr:hypothetical protein [Candidatus Kapabacteria bacterium]